MNTTAFVQKLLGVLCKIAHAPPSEMLVKLTVGEIAVLDKLVKTRQAKGGFQNLLLHLWYRLDEGTGEVYLPQLLLERIHRYAFSYGNADWRRNLRKIFRRTLGANLDRGFVLK